MDRNQRGNRYLLFRCYCFKLFYHVSMSKTRIWVITFTTWPSFCNVLHLTSIAAQDESTIPCYFSDCQAACSLNLLTYPSQIQISTFPSITTRLGLSIFWRDASLASQSSSENILMSPKNIQTPSNTMGYQQYLPLPSISQLNRRHRNPCSNASKLNAFDGRFPCKNHQNKFNDLQIMDVGVL